MSCSSKGKDKDKDVKQILIMRMFAVLLIICMTGSCLRGLAKLISLPYIDIYIYIYIYIYI
jgi:hypothetical protein